MTLHRRDFTRLALAAGLLPATALRPARAEGLKVDARTAYERAAKGHGFSVGPMMAAHPVYVFFDTTCPHCAHLWMECQPLHKRLKMVWMPVGLLRRQSAPQGATILAASDPVAAMTENETRLQNRQPGITVPAGLPPEALAKVKANTEIFDLLGADSVPLVLFRHAGTGQYGIHSGSATTDVLAAMVGL